jgi:hypothetical protein
MSPEDELAAAIEDLVDSSSLHAVLGALASTAYAKADHLQSEWQDATAARVWTRIGTKIERVASAAEESGL